MGGDGELAIRLGMLAAVAAGGWLVVLAFSAFVTRPRRPDAGPATMELGPEPPAVVNLVTSGWRLGHEAVSATLLDLAGRRIVDIEQVEPERFVVRLRREEPPSLLPYEAQVLAHVRRLASDGVVACEALTTGPEEDSKRWWQRFRKAVHAHARELGLSRARWPRGLMFALGVLALLPAGLAGAAVAAVPEQAGESSNNPVGAFLGVGFGAWFVLMMIVFSLRADRDTPDGLEAAARWLGVQEHLRHDEIFADLPPAAVAVWDRYIAYGAALDVSVGAVRALPLGAESEDEAWSAFGGQWHVVRIRYPRHFPPGWGRHPFAALAAGLFFGGIAFAVLVYGAPAIVDFKDDIYEQAPSTVDRFVFQAVDITLAVFAVAFGLALLRAVLMIAAALPDLFTTKVVEGRVVRVRRREKQRPQVAVDDGQSERVRAVSIPVGVAVPARGSDIRMRVTPRLGYVREIEVLRSPQPGDEPERAVAATEGPFAVLGQFTGGGVGGLLGLALGGVVSAIVQGVQAGADGASAPAAAPLPGVDAEAVSRAIGVPVRPLAAGEPTELGSWLGAMGGTAERAAFRADGADEPVAVLFRWPDAQPYTRITNALPAALRRPVPGVGDEAIWFAKHALLARTGDRAAAAVVGFWTKDEDARREAAARLAAALLSPVAAPAPSPAPNAPV